MSIGGNSYVRKGRSSTKEKVQKIAGPEAVQLLDRTARKMEPRMRRAFRDALERIRSRLGAQQVADLIARNDIEGVIRLINPSVTEDALQEFAAAIGDAVQEGAKTAALVQPPITGVNAEQVRFVFNATNPYLSQYARQISSTRIREVSNSFRDVTREVIRNSTVAGINPRQAAVEVRDSLGLTNRQAAAVNNFRRMLMTRDGEALTRQLRDRRFDPSIRRAIENDTPLSEQQIEKMVQRYRERYIAHRAETIARTESIRSVNGAQHQLFQSYIDDGKISPRQVRRFWHYTQDERTRMGHRFIPAMNEGGVGQDEPFDTILGPLMFPGDPDGLGENTINCRCTVFSRVVSIELIDDPFFDVNQRFRDEADRGFRPEVTASRAEMERNQ